MIMIGVDPGLTGAIAMVDATGGLMQCADIPICSNGHKTGRMRSWVDINELSVLLYDWFVHLRREYVEVTIEEPFVTPVLSSQTVASQYDTFGVMRMALANKCNWLGVHYVRPAQWKKELGVTADKASSIKECLALYPDAPVKRAKDHNRAEAILIAHYGLLIRS